MKPLRWLAAALLWLLGGVVGLLGLVTTATVILLPIGIPLLMLSGRMLFSGGRLVLPASARHPLRRAGKALEDSSERAKRHGQKQKRQARRRVKHLGRGRSVEHAAEAVVPRQRGWWHRLFS